MSPPPEEKRLMEMQSYNMTQDFTCVASLQCLGSYYYYFYPLVLTGHASKWPLERARPEGSGRICISCHISCLPAHFVGMQRAQELLGACSCRSTPRLRGSWCSVHPSRGLGARLWPVDTAGDSVTNYLMCVRMFWILFTRCFRIIDPFRAYKFSVAIQITFRFNDQQKRHPRPCSDGVGRIHSRQTLPNQRHFSHENLGLCVAKSAQRINGG